MRRSILTSLVIVFCLALLTAALRPPVAAQLTNELTLRDYNNGLRDATDILQQRIDRGGHVWIPSGTYKISRTLLVDLETDGIRSLSGNGTATLVMTGPGPAIKVVGTHFKSADPQNYDPKVWTQERMPLIDGLAITATHAEADGIEAVGTMQLTITRTHIRKCRHAVRLAQNNRNVIISNSHFYENSGCGVFYDDVNLHQSNITGCHISYNGGGGIVSRKGNVRNIHIAGCDIESNMSPDSPPTANVLIDCRESAYGTAEVAITGCTIQHNNPSPESANIRIIGRSNANEKQELVREGNVTIAGNVLSDVQVNIHLQDCRGVAVTGNTLWQGYTYNLLLEDCTNIVFAGNNLDRNPRYDYGNTADANNSVVIRRCADCSLSSLHISNVWRNPAGLLLEDCQRMHLSDSTVLDCDNCGVWLKNVSNSYVHGLMVRDDRPDSQTLSLKVTGGSGNRFGDNFLQREMVSE